MAAARWGNRQQGAIDLAEPGGLAQDDLAGGFTSDRQLQRSHETRPRPRISMICSRLPLGPGLMGRQILPLLARR